MKIRLAKKIMRACNGCVPYLQQILCCSDIARDLPKLKQYWEPRWALCIAIEHGRCGRKDHRITKAQALSLRKKMKEDYGKDKKIPNNTYRGATNADGSLCRGL